MIHSVRRSPEVTRRSGATIGAPVPRGAGGGSMSNWKKGLTLAALVLAVGVVWAQEDNVPVPVYKVDPNWPKMPLPNGWLIQGVPVMVTDSQDHIWVVSRPRDITPDE